MKAIVTKYHGPTDCKGSRFSAEAEGVSRIYLSYDYALNSSDNHRKAAEALCAKLEWTGKLVSGNLPDGRVAHVFIS